MRFAVSLRNPNVTDKIRLPFGVYDTKQCGLAHIGLYDSEAACWEIYLGWPAPEEIADAKARGLKVIPLTVSYNP